MSAFTVTLPDGDITIRDVRDVIAVQHVDPRVMQQWLREEVAAALERPYHVWILGTNGPTCLAMISRADRDTLVAFMERVTDATAADVRGSRLNEALRRVNELARRLNAMSGGGES